MTRHSASLAPDYFAGMYAGHPDPWSFATSPYEREKYAATLAALPRARYGTALEVGCSIGIFTRQLAARCDAVVAVDVVPSVLEAAAAACADAPTITFMFTRVPDDWPAGAFDLIVLSEVAYYLTGPDLLRLVTRVENAVQPGADVVLVHWLGETDYPLSGDEAAEGFISAAAAFARPLRQTRTDRYRLDVLRAADPAGGPAA